MKFKLGAHNVMLSMVTIGPTGWRMWKGKMENKWGRPLPCSRLHMSSVSATSLASPISVYCCFLKKSYILTFLICDRGYLANHPLSLILDCFLWKIFSFDGWLVWSIVICRYVALFYQKVVKSFWILFTRISFLWTH